jgi:hypothetical protein
MSKENVELWRASIEDLLASASEAEWEGWIARAAELWDPDIEWDASPVPTMFGAPVLRGKESVKQWWRDWFEAWRSTSFAYELIDAGDRVVCLIEQVMVGRSTGIEVPFGKAAQVATFRDGLMVHWKLYLSQAEALEAAGLSE